VKYTRDPSALAPSNVAAAAVLHAPPGSERVREHREADTWTLVVPLIRAQTCGTLLFEAVQLGVKKITRPSVEMA
jgi:hypothetical protein